MSVSFGPLNSFADFFAGLDASLAYVRSVAFWYVPLRGTLLEELSAIRAWTFDGRVPLLAERSAVYFPHTLYRAREDMRITEPPDDLAQIELASEVVGLFMMWPESEELLRHGDAGVVSSARSPDPGEFLVVIGRIEAALAPLAAVWPLAPAFNSRQPLMRDTMSTAQWARWVLLPRLKDVVKGVEAPPERSQLATLARGLALDEAMWPLLYALGELDELFHEPVGIRIRLEPLIEPLFGGIWGVVRTKPLASALVCNTREIKVTLSDARIFDAGFTESLGDALEAIGVQRALASHYTPLIHSLARRKMGI